MKYLTILFLGILCIGCGPDTMYESEQEVYEKWTHDESVTFDFNVTDTINTYNILLDVYHSNDFKFQNLYSRLVTTFPNAEKSESIISLDFKTLSGKSLGKCSGDNCKVSFTIQGNTFFKQNGMHKLEIFQESRLDTITGINKLSLSIQKTE